MSAGDDDGRRAVERWLVDHGVPQLIQGYRDEQQLDARATPLIAIWLAIATAWWTTRPDEPLATNAVTVAGALTFVLVAYSAVAWLRRRTLRPPPIWDLGDIAVFGLLPALPVAAVHDPLSGAVVFGWTLLGVSAIYLVVAFGVLEIAGWAARRVVVEAEHIIGLLARTLPLLLILVVFLLFAAELWEIANAMELVELALILALLMLVAALLVANTARAELRRIESDADPMAAPDAVRGTPAAALPVERPIPAPPPLGRLERTNLGLVIVLNQLVQSLFVGLVLMAFLVVLGWIAVPASVQERWIGEPVRVLVHVDLLGEMRTLSLELLIAAALLGGIVGLYFTGLSVTDSVYRRDSFGRVLDEVEQIAAVRTVYLASARAPAPVRASRGPGR